ncbi:MAG TPA: dihydrofolate reductase family protein [Rhizomicrobium sp.]|jgi:dihydrofolate reductase|nr:dihydrofolate reductase family protein [Rhizomicrobium sp.]
MRRIVATTFVSLDGVMQAPGGPEEDPAGGFSYGGWTFPHFDQAGGAFMSEVFSGPFDLLLGRKTYDIFASYWPQITDPNHPIAEPFNRVTKYVASRANPKLAWQNSRWLGTDTVGSLKTLKNEEGPDLIVQGSSDFLQTLWTNRLVDDFTVLIFPVVLGHGKRLFEDGTTPSGLKLLRSQSFPAGVIAATYRPDGAVKTGSFAEP